MTNRKDSHSRAGGLRDQGKATVLNNAGLDLWRQDLTELLAEAPAAEARASSFFGGLYRKVVVTRGEAETGAERLAA